MALVRRLTHDDGWLVLHLLVPGVPAAFAVVLAMPGHTFALTGEVFSGMARLGEEWQWALASGACAILGDLGVTTDAELVAVSAP